MRAVMATTFRSTENRALRNGKLLEHEIDSNENGQARGLSASKAPVFEVSLRLRSDSLRRGVARLRFFR